MNIEHLTAFVLHLWVERIVSGTREGRCLVGGCRGLITYTIVARVLETHQTFALGLCDLHASKFPHFEKEGWSEKP